MTHASKKAGNATTNGRSEARSVILRLRRYRDRMQEIATAVAAVPAAGGGNTVAVQRQIKSLRSDLANDAHECVIGQKRMKQTECEHEFLWPALQQAADAIRDGAGPVPVDARSQTELNSAQGRIQHYLTQLEGRWPTL